MATEDRYPFAIDSTRWDIPGQFETTFRWEYEHGRPAMEGLMRSYRSALFTRIVPTIKEIGLWGPRIRKAYAEMGILGFADIDGEALAMQDESIAERFDKERAQRN